MLAFLLPVIDIKDGRNLSLAKQKELFLAEALLRKNDKALDFLYQSYSASLLGIISKVIRQEDVAEDVLQESFLKIWNCIDQYNPEKGRLFTWMARLARNKAIDHLRSRTEINKLKNDNISEFTLEINKLHQIQVNTEFIGLKQLLNALRPEHTKVLDMVYFQGYTQLEVSEILNIPIGTVKTRIRVAIKTMRSFF